MTAPVRSMYFGKRACDPASGAASAVRPPLMWQLVHLMFPGAYSGRLSDVCMTRASPRRIDAPSESFGISESGGGCHVAGSNEPYVIGDAAAAVPACRTFWSARSPRHATTSSEHDATRASTRGMDRIRVSVFIVIIRVSILENTPAQPCGLSADFRRRVGISPI